MVRGGATNPAGSALPGATFGAASIGMAMATLARPLALSSAALMEARNCDVAFWRQASMFPAAPEARLQARTMGLPTVSQQLTRATSTLSVCAAFAVSASTAVAMAHLDVAA